MPINRIEPYLHLPKPPLEAADGEAPHQRHALPRSIEDGLPFDVDGLPPLLPGDVVALGRGRAAGDEPAHVRIYAHDAHDFRAGRWHGCTVATLLVGVLVGVWSCLATDWLGWW
jgi:hypothetical protein